MLFFRLRIRRSASAADRNASELAMHFPRSSSSAASPARCGAVWRRASSSCPKSPFEIEPALREVDFGEWEGKTLDWAESNAAELLAQRRSDPVRFRPPGGESIEDAAVRLRPLAERLRVGERTLVIAHRLSLGILERLLRDLPLDSKLVTQLEPGEFRIVTAAR